MDYLQLAYLQGMNKAAQEFGFASYENFKKEAGVPWRSMGRTGLNGALLGAALAGGTTAIKSLKTEDSSDEGLRKSLKSALKGGVVGGALGAGTIAIPAALMRTKPGMKFFNQQAKTDAGSRMLLKSYADFKSHFGPNAAKEMRNVYGPELDRTLKQISVAMKKAEEEGVAHGAIRDPDFDSNYRELNVQDSISRAMDTLHQQEDPSSMTQPGLLHGALNQMYRAGVNQPEGIGIPLFSSPVTG